MVSGQWQRLLKLNLQQRVETSVQMQMYANDHDICIRTTASTIHVLSLSLMIHSPFVEMSEPAEALILRLPFPPLLLATALFRTAGESKK